MDFWLGIRLAAWSVVVMCVEEWSIVGGKTMKWGKSEWRRPLATAGLDHDYSKYNETMKSVITAL